MTGEALSGAHFALYRSVEGIGGAVKDLYPIAGYEDLVSGSDGVIPGIDNTLAPGKYYLTEVTPPDGHDANEDDIIFTVFANGVVAIDSVGHSGYLSVEGTTECNYILRVPNSPNRPVELTITKTVTGAFGDKTKEFTFTLSVENAEPSDEYAWSKNGVPQAEPLRGNLTFTLRHGESVKITLPIFRRITITESNENYSTSFKLNDTAASVGNTKTFTLDNYADAEWAKQHADIEFDTDDEHRVYRVFAAVRTDVGGENDFKYYEKTGKLSDNEYNALVKELSGISVIDIGENPGGKKQILMLSTCSYHTDNGRFVVAAYRV